MARVVLWHGFAQDGSLWSGFDGDAPTLDPPAVPSSPTDAVLVGYSMGARLALLAALERAPLALVLVSGSAGLADPAARRARQDSDERLAQAIERFGTPWFADAWEGLGLWDGEPMSVREVARAQRLAQSPVRLAAMLRAWGPGTLPAAWDRLGAVGIPVVVLAGERDRRYVAIGQRLADALPRGDLRVVPGAGHAIPLEAPDAIRAAVAGLTRHMSR